ncbi:MAG TPA: hypothetical protein VLC28_13800, partial [Flavitalea sp.]|nr:hypothetical protein [Flavitalea sp.]
MKALAVFPIVISILCCIGVQAQQFGGHSSSEKWRHIHNDSIDIIFQHPVADKASAIYSLISKIPATLPSPHRVKRLPLVLQQKTSFSNGYVGMGPYRSEFQLTPLQNSFQLGSIPWYAELALHEYRHVQQFDYFNRGIARVVYSVLGQEAGSLINNTAIPNWFWEGDAVWQETRLSSQGRGRIPFFLNDVRTILRSPRNYSYMKWRNGSLRDLVPDHYPFGYLLIGYGEEKYGPRFWPATIADASRFKPLFYPLQGALKRQAKIPFKQFTREALSYYREKEHRSTDSLSQWANAQKHFVSDAEFPTWINSDEVLYVKTSYREIPAFYIYNTGTNTERRIGNRKISLDYQFSYNNGRIVYSSYQADRRWSWSDYSTIVITDLQTNTEHQITSKQKYFSPDINIDGTKIVAVQIDSSSNSQLQLLDVGSGTLLKSMPNEENYFITYPKFYHDGSVISAVRDSIGQMAIVRWEVTSGAKTFLLPFSKQVIGFPQVANDTIVFTSTDQDKESVFMLVPGKSFKKLHTGNTTSFSVYQPSLYGKNIVVSGASVAGSQLLRFDDTAFADYPVKDFLNLQPEGPFDFNALDTPALFNSSASISKRLPSQAYQNSKHLLNFHSIRPFISDPDYSISLVSENVLNDFRTELTYLYNTNEGYNQFGFFATYAGLFPWIRGGVDYTLNRNYIYNSHELRWDEIQPRIGLSVPLDFSKNYHFR